MSPETVRARRLVEARLGRGPQDALEAAVVLEAWAGVPAQRALETARAMMPAVSAAPPVSRSVAEVARRPRGLALEGVAFLITVVAIALWGEPLGAALGAEAVGRALRIALPVTVALQWMLLARHLGRPSGLDGLAHRRAALVVTAIVLVAAGRLAFGDAGTLAALLIVTWVGGTVVIRRGWSALYCAVVLATVAALEFGAPALAVVAAAATIIAVAAVLALRTGTGAATPGPWSRAAVAGLTGLGVGILLVGDPSVSWAAGAVAALALVPSAAGALWAGHHLWRLAGAFPRALAGVPAIGGDGAHGREPLRIFGGGLLRLVVLTAAGSVAVAVLSPAQPGVLVAFGLAALATTLVGLLDALGTPRWGLIGVAAGVTGELVARQFEAPFSGSALCAGTAVAIAVLAPATLVLLVRPARTLATTMWIP